MIPAWSPRGQIRPPLIMNIIHADQLNPEDSEDAKKLFHEAMERGYVTSQDLVIVLVGIAGSGKSSFKRVILDLPQEEVRISTPIAEAAIRNISISRAVVGDSESIKWEVVSSEELLSMLADAIKVGVPKDLVEGSSVSAKVLAEESTDNHDKNMNHLTIKSVSSQSTQGNIQQSKSNSNLQDDPLLPLICKSKGSRRLLDVRWVYIIDTGGQPQFLQLLPAFIRNLSSCVCLLRLDQNLDEKPLVKYFDNSGKQCGESYPSEHTNLQVVESCVRTIHSRCSLFSNAPPNCFIIGTHLDEYEKKTDIETIDEKNKKLLERLSNLPLEQSLIFYKSGDDAEKLIFPLNCKHPEERDQNVAAEFRKCVMSRCHEPEHKIPLAWFVLEEHIRQYAINQKVAYLEKSTCFKIAQRLCMSARTFQVALNHLLKLNIFRCYSSLPDLIFCDKQVILMKLTELVQYSFQLKKSTVYGISREDISFKNEGIISVTFLSDSRFSSFYSDTFTPQKFLKILRELLAVADMSNKKYFMPCLLNGLKEGEISKYRRSSESLSPLLIFPEGGCLPNGLFSSLVAALKNIRGWDLAYCRHKPACLHQNCIMFSLPGDLPGTVVLIASFNYLEVHVCMESCVESRINSICARLLEDIDCSLADSWKVLYPGEISCKLGFFCNSSKCSSDNNELHIANVSKCGEFERCSILPGNGLILSESKLHWLRNIHKCSILHYSTTHCQRNINKQCLVDSELDVQPQLLRVSLKLSSLPDTSPYKYFDKVLDWDDRKGVDRDLNGIAKHMRRWEVQLAVPLGLTLTDIEDIKDMYKRKPELQRREVLRRWKDEKGLRATYGHLYEIFTEAHHIAGASAIQEILKKKATLGKHAMMSPEDHSHSTKRTKYTH